MSDKKVICPTVLEFKIYPDWGLADMILELTLPPNLSDIRKEKIKTLCEMILEEIKNELKDRMKGKSIIRPSDVIKE